MMIPVGIIYFGRVMGPSSSAREWGLLAHLKTVGLQVADEGPRAFVIFIDFNLRSIWRLFVTVRSRRILIVFEPKAVNPLVHKAWFQKLFGLVIVSSGRQQKETNIFVEPGGWNAGRLAHDSGSARNNSIACAFGNKVSLVSSSGYSLRHDVLVRLGRGQAPVFLAGPGWNSWWIPVKGYVHSALRCAYSWQRIDFSKLRFPFSTQLRKLPALHYEGWVDDEIDFFRQHGCVLVIENDSEFLSEKVFHAIASRRPVVYSGPGDPRELEKLGVICCPPDPDQIAFAAMRVLRDQQISHISSSDLLENSFLEHHSVGAFYERVAREVRFYVDAHKD